MAVKKKQASKKTVAITDTKSTKYTATQIGEICAFHPYTKVYILKVNANVSLTKEGWIILLKKQGAIDKNYKS